VDLNFAEKNNLIRPFNTIYTVGPSACDVQGVQNSSAHLTPVNDWHTASLSPGNEDFFSSPARNICSPGTSE